jgi:hypothetical protein
MNAVLNTSLYLPLGKREVTRAAAEASFVQDLLCYETVYVLADQMEAVGVLTAFMGAEPLIEALESGAIKFVYDRHMIAWPQKPPGYIGAMPILLMHNHGRESDGFSMRSPAQASEIVLRGFQLDQRTHERLVRAVEDNTIEMTVPEPEQRTTGGLAESVTSELRLFGQAVVNIPQFPLELADINRLIRDIRNAKKSPLNTTRLDVAKFQTHSGWKLLDEQQPVPKKQLAMINLFLASRFLVAHASAGPNVTLHTEPIVEQILAARAASIRSAAGSEVDVVLDAEQVYLPVLKVPGQLSYGDVLKARNRRTGESFRAVVQRRDESSEELIQSYLATLDMGLGNRFGVKLARFVTGTLVGAVLTPLAGAAVSALDSFLIDRVFNLGSARYFVDTTLRRIASGKDAQPRMVVRE